jgi:hypothetical protein
VNRLGPLYYQLWGGMFTMGFALALAIGSSYWCVEFRRDPRHR